MEFRGFIVILILASFVLLGHASTTEVEKKQIRTVRDERDRLFKLIDYAEDDTDLRMLQMEVHGYFDKHKHINPGKAKYFAGELHAKILNKFMEFSTYKK